MGNPRKWGALGPRPWSWAWLTAKNTTLPVCVTTPNLVIVRGSFDK